MKNILLFCFLFSLMACAKYETRFEGPYDASGTANVLAFKRDILFVESGQIKWTDNLLQKTEVVPVSGSAKKARANANNSKIAYSDFATGTITIVDSLGNNPQVVPNSAGAKCFFWHFNNQTLCFLNSSRQLKTFGTAVSIPIPTFSSQQEIYEMEFLKDGTLITLLKTNGTFYNYNILVDKQGSANDYSIDLGQYPDPKWLKVGKYTNPDIIFGYEWAGNSSNFGSKKYTFGSKTGFSDFGGDRWRIDAPDGKQSAVIRNGVLALGSYQLPVNESTITDLDW
jgi:hypothetical protein